MGSTYSIIVYPAKDLPQSYKALIFSKWLRSFRAGNDLIKMIDSKAYYDSYHGYIEHLLAKPESVVRLAVLTEDHDVVLGFSIYRDTVLDYIYVQKDMRNMGIGFQLTPDRITHFTHLTKNGQHIWRKRHKQWIFNPFC